MWTIERLRMLKKKEWTSLGLTAKELDEYEKLSHRTGLTGEALREAWLARNLLNKYDIEV